MSDRSKRQKYTGKGMCEVHTNLPKAPGSGVWALYRSETAQNLNKPYKPIYGPNYTPRQTSFYTSGQGKFAGEPK